ncbi:MAG: GHKL domain-containing protein [Desulfuromonadaceae bacterium]|nr:GHKL domain-containing protein [Desulfuromonadaceae bacterium]
MRPPGFSFPLAQPWKVNLLIFALLLAGVLSYFFWQIRSSRELFEEHLSEHSRLITQIVASSVENAEQAEQVVEAVVTTFLQNTGRFVAYLDAVEPFTPSELAALAAENGLTGLCLERPDQPPVSAPAGWFQRPDGLRSDQLTLLHQSEAHQYVLVLPLSAAQGTVILGLPARRIEDLMAQMDVPQMLETLSQLTGIAALRLEEGQTPASEVQLADGSGRRLQCLGDKTLVLETASGPLNRRIAQLWQQFWWFAATLTLSGLLLSWLLYRYQSRYLLHRQILERELAQQREDASLGRATATISHEIRNPLNAIAMGLQRLQLELPQLEAEQRCLIEAMTEAVQRTNGIVRGLQKYTRPLAPCRQPLDLSGVVEKVLTLYRDQAMQQQVNLDVRLEAVVLDGDADLLGQLVENLLKNALEAQPEGGVVRVRLQRQQQQAVLILDNPCPHVEDSLIEKMEQPYFTTKTRGSGLGLSLVGKIAKAHEGVLTLRRLYAGWLRVELVLPLKRSAA